MHKRILSDKNHFGLLMFQPALLVATVVLSSRSVNPWPRPYSSARLALLCHPKPDPPEEPTGKLEEKYYGGNINIFHCLSMLNHFIRCCSGKYVVFRYTQIRSHKCPFFLYEVGSASAGFASSFTLRHVHVKFPWMKCESGGSWIAICLWVWTT